MASEAIKKMFLERMFKRRQAQQAGEAFKSIAGTPEQQIDVHVPDPTAQSLQPGGTLPQGASPFGLMNVEQQTQPATGLFDTQNPDRFQQFAINAAGSSVPSLQKYGLEQIGGMGESGMPTAADYLGAKTFAYGAGDGQMQRGVLGKEGVVPIGQPYDPRNPYLNTGTEFTNYNRPGSEIPINLSQAQFEKKQGDADFKFLDNYSVNVDKGEAGLEAMDFLMSGLDEMANTATGWSTGLGSILKDFPTSEANAWQSMKTTVLSGLGLDKMAELKSLSSTGSTGFGALNEKELELLVSYRGKLEQTNDAKIIKKMIGNMQRLIGNARKRTVRRLTNAKKRFNKLAPERGYETTGVTPQANNLEAPEPTDINDLVNKYAD